MSDVQIADMYLLVWHARFNIDSPDALVALIGDLVEAGLEPTHFGIPDKPAEDYTADRIRRWWAGHPGDLMLYRRKAPTYEMLAYSASGVGNAYWPVTLFVRKKVSAKWPPVLFDLHERLSMRIQPLFGGVYPSFRDSGASWGDRAAPSITTRFDLMPHGLPPVGARTWLGPHAVAQIGRDRLESAPGVVVHSHGDAVVVDVHGDPWTLDGPATLERTRAVTAHLAESGVFGRYDIPSRSSRPRNHVWKPPPDAKL